MDFHRPETFGRLRFDPAVGWLVGMLGVLGWMGQGMPAHTYASVYLHTTSFHPEKDEMEGSSAAATIQQRSKTVSVDGQWERRISLCKCVCIIIDKCQCAFVLLCFYRVAVVHACLVLCIFRAQLPPGLFDRLYVCDDLPSGYQRRVGYSFRQLPSTGYDVGGI